VDNASCSDVRDFLLAEQQAGRIDYLILNATNVGYPNGLLQVLASAPGEYVFYTDGDVYFRPGWMEAHLRIARSFPNVGLVLGVPVRGTADYYTRSTMRWVEAHEAALTTEQGDLIPEEWTAEFATGLGFPGQVERAFGPDWRDKQDYRITYDGTTAFVGGIPFEFLTTRAAIANLPRSHDGHLMDKPEVFLDAVLDEAGLLRLCATQPYAYHIGNRIMEDWLVEAFERLVGGRAPAGAEPRAKRHWLWGRRKVRRLVRKLHQWSFEKYYGNS
jgi:hypothetical protein